MVDRIPKLLRADTFDVARFFAKLQPGAIFTYSDAYMHNEVVELARKHGKLIMYYEPGTAEYHANGCFTCGVTGTCLKLEQRVDLMRDIHAAWRILREVNSTIPDESLDFMRDAALEKLETI